MDIYREEILEHWKNPQNFGKMRRPSVVIDQINPLCGDQVRFFFKFSLRMSSSPSIGVEGKLQRGSGFSIKSSTVSLRPNRSRMTKGDSRKISDVSFTGNGCAISIASASILSEYIKNKSIDVLAKITGEDVLDLIGGPVSPARLKCAFLPLEAIRKIAKFEAPDFAKAKTGGRNPHQQGGQAKSETISKS